MLTKRGWQLSLAAVVVVGVGRVLAVVELVVMGISVLTLVGVSAAWIATIRLRLRLQRSVNPIRVYAGDRAVVNLRLTNQGRRTPVFTITDLVTGTDGATLRTGPLRTGMSSEGSYRLPTDQRGHLQIGPAKVTVSDPLGIAAVTATVGEPTKFTIYPRIMQLPSMTLPSGPEALSATSKLHSLHRVGEDFYALRDYTVGDDPRRIHWRSTARLGRPMVREGEVPRQNQLSILLDNRATSYGRGDTRNRSFDTAVSVTASIVTAALRRGDAVKLVSTSDAVIGFSTTSGRGAREIFEYLAEISLSDFGALRPALGRLGGRGTGAVVAVVGHRLQDISTDTSSIASLARQVSSLVTLRVGSDENQIDADRPATPPHTPNALVDVTDLEQLPTAWGLACTRAAQHGTRTGPSNPVGAPNQ